MKTIHKRPLITVLACALACLNIAAQENDFDLNSQRSEKQNIVTIQGSKVDHKGIIINPTPQEMSVDMSGKVDLSAGVALKDKQNKFADDLGFVSLNQKGARLVIDFGAKAAAKKGVKAVSGAYAMSVNKKGVTITGYDERGAFYGIQTLRQLLASEAVKGSQLPYTEINDYPDLPDRGVVEGFYGNPWSHEVRLSLIDFYGKFKMNTYIYGPKDDPYHSSPNWRLPYPEKEARNIGELIAACKRNRVDFVWAIHPGQDIKWNQEDYNNLVGKFNIMYDLGVRHFAIFFDDISGEGTNPLRQTELLNNLTKDFVQAKGDVGSLTICPTDYSKLWANPTENGSLAIYGKTLNPDIKVFWTGDVVCSDLTPETLDFINTRIKRPAYYWWNYPVTDYARNYLLQGPVYGLDTSLTSDDLCGFVSNPMEYGEASKLALYGVSDYTWNIAKYNPIDNWERGLAELMPDASEAYRTFAIHSGDTETGYRRAESWETETFKLADWDDGKAQKLEQEFMNIEAAAAKIESSCANKQLLSELRPWIEEFGKLGTRGKKAVELGRIYRSANSDPAAFWGKYVQNTMSNEEREQFEAHKSGTMKLQPFYENMMDDMAHGFLKSVMNEEPKDYRGIGSFASARTVQTKAMFDNDSTTYYTSGVSQRKGSWIGVDLQDVREVSEVSVLQGRNSVNDVDYFDHAVLEYSEDGKTWSPLIEELTNQYVISWKGDAVKARYVRLRRLDSKRTNYASVRSFDVNPLRAENLGFSLEVSGNAQGTLSMFDQNASTAYKCDGTVTFGVPSGTAAYTVLTGEISSPLTCKEYDAKGKEIGSCSIDEPYSRIKLAGKGVSKVSIEGKVEIYEIIPMK